MRGVQGVKVSQKNVEGIQILCYPPVMRQIIGIAGLLALSALAGAHNLHQSTSTITATGKTLTWAITAHDRDAKRLNPLKPYLNHRIVVENNGAACALSEAHVAPSPDEAGHSLITMQFDCAAPIAKLTLYYNLFFGQRDHVHTATVHLGQTSRTVSFTGMKTSASL